MLSDRAISQNLELALIIKNVHFWLRMSYTRTTFKEHIWQLFSQALFVDHCHEVKVNLMIFCHDDFGV